MFEDSQGGLWVGTETAGVVLIKDGQVKSLDIGRGSREGRLLSVCEDTNGAVWLYTAAGELCRHRKGSVDVWDFGTQYPSAYRAVMAEASGLLWVGVDWGLYGFSQTAVASPRELPALEQVLPAGKLDYLLAGRRGGLPGHIPGQRRLWPASRGIVPFCC